jgi:hypothetical protein
MIYFFLMGVYELFAAKKNMEDASQRATAEAEFYGKFDRN